MARGMGLMLGDVVRQYRKARGLKQGALADRVGTTQSVISEIEKGVRVNLTRDLLGRLANALQVPPAELLAAADSELPRPELPNVDELPPEVRWIIRHAGDDLNAEDIRAIYEFAAGRALLRRQGVPEPEEAIGYHRSEPEQAETEAPVEEAPEPREDEGESQGRNSA